MIKKMKIRRYHTLLKWIVLGCVTLLVPITCAVLNFFINKNLIEQKIDQVNTFMLKNIQYNIDSKLKDILDMSKYYVMDPNFTMYALSTEDEAQFLERAGVCYQSLSMSNKVNSDIEIMIYLQEKKYLIGSATANHISQVYGSLVMQNRLTISLEEWRKLLGDPSPTGFVISDKLSYNNCGKDSLTYIIPVLYSGPGEAGYVYTSMSTAFIDKLMENESNMHNTILILDGDNNVISQYGEELDMDGIEFQINQEQHQYVFDAKNGRYVGVYAESEIAEWKYVVFVPEQIYQQEMQRNRKVNLLIVFAGTVLGVWTVITFQRKNYMTVQQLIRILPEREEEYDRDEFVVMENKLRRIYDENQSMQHNIENRLQYNRELDLLSAIKGRSRFYKKLSVEDLLGYIPKEMGFAFVTIGLDMEEDRYGQEMAIKGDLLLFVIDNVIAEVFGEAYPYIKTVDDVNLVYLFMIKEGTAMTGWKSASREKFGGLYEFFYNRLHTELSITLGSLFNSFEYIESAYAEMEETNEQRYYTQPYGILGIDMVHNVDFSSVGRLKYYNKLFEEAAQAVNFEKGKALSEELFVELERAGISFHQILYYFLSIANNILMVSKHTAQDEKSRAGVMDECLSKLRYAESLSTLKSEFYQFLRLICRVVDKESQDTGNLSEAIKIYVKNHYTDCNMNISAIAEVIGLTPRYMSQIFKEQTNMNLLNFINDVRIEHAKILLKTTNKTIEEIAVSTGFGNTRTFRRNFQKATGITAASFKQVK